MARWSGRDAAGQNSVLLLLLITLCYLSPMLVYPGMRALMVPMANNARNAGRQAEHTVMAAGWQQGTGKACICLSMVSMLSCILYLLCHHPIPYLVVSLHLLNIDKQALAFILMGTITCPLG